MLVSISVIRAKGKGKKTSSMKNTLKELCKNGKVQNAHSCLPTCFFFLIGAKKAGINHSNK
jgi:hypothetical protein